MIEGLKYVYMTKVLLRAISLVLIMGTFILNFNVLIPVYENLLWAEMKQVLGF